MRGCVSSGTSEPKTRTDNPSILRQRPSHPLGRLAMTYTPQAWRRSGLFFLSYNSQNLAKSPHLGFFLDRFTSVNVEQLPRIRKLPRLLRHQLNYVLTTCPPDMLLMAQLASRQNISGIQHSARVEKGPFRGSTLLRSASKTRVVQKNEDAAMFPRAAVTLAVCVPSAGKSQRSAQTLPFPPAREEPPWNPKITIIRS